MFNIKYFTYCSLNKKIILSFFTIALILILLFFAIVVPSLKEIYKDYIYNNIEQTIEISNEETKMATKSLSYFIGLQEENLILNIEKEIEVYNSKIQNKALNKIKLKLFLENKINCTTTLKNKKTDLYPINQWYKTNNPKITDDLMYEQFISYNKLLFNKKILLVSCDKDYFETDHSEFEKDIKENLQKSFSKSFNIHKGKIVVLGMDYNWASNKNNLFKEDDDQPYGISNLSNIYTLPIGKLKPIDIINIAKENKSKLHKINGKNALTWVKIIHKSHEDISLLIITSYVDDIEKDFNSSILKIIVPILIFLLLVGILFYLALNKLLYNIKDLSLTAKEIINGNHKVRTKITGSDEIGILGLTFNTMLNNIEDNIMQLDQKVNSKTRKLKDSLDEKELLLKEIHHRVKNNLAITIGFIELEVSKIRDVKTKNILINIQSRIYTMELVHTKLYQSKDLNQISYKEYIVSLVSDISESFNLNKTVKIDLKVEKVYMNINYAIPCGLVINELITNAFKYAFKENESPKLNINLTRINNTVNVRIQDNGKGFSNSKIHKNPSTLGLKLVKSIIQSQLEGTVVYSYNKGSIFDITFDIED